MTWEETIIYIRTKPEFKDLVEKAYFEEDLKLNIERFRKSDEYTETLKLITKYQPKAKSILDIGSGNGISAISFALDGFKVTVSEPDQSSTVGTGAIRELQKTYDLQDFSVYEDFAENIDFSGKLFDVVYVRQAMHHANDLNQFVKNLSTLLKPDGLFLTIRDHVIYDEQDKLLFLESHPLQKFYGGENAYTSEEYENAIKKAGLQIIRKIKYYDSVINYFPLTTQGLNQAMAKRKQGLKNALKKKIGFFALLPFVWAQYKKKHKKTLVYDEKNVPGRMYSFVALKK